MGNRSRTKNKLFNLNDLIYELSDYLIVLELAVQSKALGSHDPGRTLKSLLTSFHEYARGYNEEFGELPSIDLKHLYPVAKHLADPKESSQDQVQWLTFSGEDGTYKFNSKGNEAHAKAELERLAVAIESVHARISALMKKL